MVIGILKEANDQRVAIVPATLKKLQDLVDDIWVESNAGLNAGFEDSAYQEQGKIKSREEILSQADVIISINPMSEDDLAKMKEGATVMAMFAPFANDQIVDVLRKHKVKAFSFDMIPRTTLAQSMDILSAMASIAGYKAVIQSADALPRYFPMMITAAGSIKPATVLILGAGVAGLQAIATAKRLGAMVEAFDVRSAAKEEVLSLGAKFIEVEGAVDDKDAGGYAVQQSEEYLQRQRAEVQNRASKADVIITTAQVRGRKAPILLPAETVEKMKRGSVVVDLAASTGGNCALTQNGQTIVTENGVKIIGDSNLPSTMAQDASTLVSNNIFNFLKYIIKEGAINYDMEDEIISSAFITK
ncbi:MAG TPA: Re/Si-specific NAD(P)(+) transhydrogenase subunit alpha [Saprospiraceae bacterium]|nr:Re/Si-specific NAD(P)(+) transhydrogenase subunit alpha [Saprospiraceae bacterium]